MRCFISIPVNEKIRNCASEMQKQIDFNGVRLVDLDKMHLTVLFLGELNEEKVLDVKRKLDCVKFKCFSFSVSGIGFFPSEKYIRVIWMGINSEKLNKLVEQICAKFDVRFDFIPHITLARIKRINSKNKIKLLNNIKKYKNKNFGKVNVENIKLMKSILNKSGSKYYEIYSKKLD